MNNTTNLAKWGNSLAVRIPKWVASGAQLREGDSVTLEIGNDGSVLMRAARRRYKLEDLVSQITAGNRHNVTSWGRAVGKESW